MAAPDKALAASASGTVCLLGHHEAGYPRNISVRNALEAAGFQVIDVHSRTPFPWRHVILTVGYLRCYRQVRWVFVTEGGHRLTPLIKLLTFFTGRKLAFDPYLSRYNTRIEDRRLYPPKSLQAFICRWQDWSSTQAADLLFFDTQEHKDYFYRAYRLRKPYAIFPVGVDDTLFRPRASTGTQSAVTAAYPLPGFQVLFYGSFIPLQGIEWIVEAAALLQATDVRFTLVGEGQTSAEIRVKAQTLGADNIRFLPSMPMEILVGLLAAADLNLGIFGDTQKAGNVVANKIVQGAALGRPMITRDSPAVRGYFRDGESIALVPAADARALADKILDLRNDPDTRMRLGATARKVFEERFSTAALAAILKAALT